MFVSDMRISGLRLSWLSNTPSFYRLALNVATSLRGKRAEKNRKKNGRSPFGFFRPAIGTAEESAAEIVEEDAVPFDADLVEHLQR